MRYFFNLYIKGVIIGIEIIPGVSGSVLVIFGIYEEAIKALIILKI